MPVIDAMVTSHAEEAAPLAKASTEHEDVSERSAGKHTALTQCDKNSKEEEQSQNHCCDQIVTYESL
jgi:hypothetical protein